MTVRRTAAALTILVGALSGCEVESDVETTDDVEVNQLVDVDDTEDAPVLTQGEVIIVTLPPAPVATQVIASPATDPRFGTCREALDAGYGDYLRGIDPEYDWYRDADSDGVVCERP